MSEELRVGNRVSIFVTHVGLQNSACQVFAHVGDLGSQADTVIERTDEHVGSGAAEIPASCSVGDMCLALFHEDNGWYRARVTSTENQSVTVFFIDYGNTETVTVDKLRSASEYVLAIPALSTKCHVSNCIPLNEQSWTEEEMKKYESMLHSQEFSAEVLAVEHSAPISTCTVKLFKTDEPSVPVFVRKSTSNSDLSIKSEDLQVGQEYTVFVSFVESPKKFWVQLKDKEEELNSLMSDIGACFAEDLPSTGDILNPTVNQICASCFSEDGSFYRAKIQSVSGDSCKVFFVDYGNSEKKSTSELFTLPQVLSSLPVQAIQCSYRSNTDPAVVEECLHKIESDGTACIIKTLSKSDLTNVVQIDSIEKKVQQSQPHSQSRAKADGKLWASIPSVVMQLGGVYDVCVSHAEHPGRFFLQLIGNASKLDSIMQNIDEVAHNLDGVVICAPGSLCIAKFSDNAWYRSEILSSEAGHLTLGAVDFGFVEKFLSKQLVRKIDPKFKELPAQSVVCTLDPVKLNSSDWSDSEKDKFSAVAEKTPLVCKVKAKIGAVYQVDLFDTASDQERHIYQELKSQNTIVNNTEQKIPDRSSTAKVRLLPPETTLSSQITLCVTAIRGTLIFGQVTHTPVEKVAKLQTELNTHYDKQATQTLENSTIGSVCCTKYSDGGWYRAIVTSVQGNEVEVSFADFGDSIMKSKSELKVLIPSLCELPQQCILVSIENLPSVPKSKLESVLVNNRIDIKLKRKEDGVYPQFIAELLSQSVLDELQGKPASGFGAKRSTGFGQSSDSGSQRSGFGNNRDIGFVNKRDGGFGDKKDSGFGGRSECFGARKGGGGFGAKQDGGFGSNRSAHDRKEGGGFGGNRDRGGFGEKKDISGFGERKEGGGFGGNRDRGDFGGRRDERSFGGSSERSGFGDRKGDGGFGDRKSGLSSNKEERIYGGNRDGGGFGKREGSFGNKRSEGSQERTNFRGTRAPSGDSGGFTKQEVQIGSTKGVMVTYVRDPGHFQVVLEDMSDSLDMVMDQMHEHYDKLPPTGEQLEEPRLGQACVAQFSEDKGWYRAIISGLLSNGLSEVMFVDYGNNECTPRENLKIIKDGFMTLPAQAILCSLAGVAPSQGFWSPEHTVQFEEMVVEQSFTATFKSQSREPGEEVVFKVELVDKQNTSINQKFGNNTGTTCVESSPGPTSRMVSSGGTGMNITVSGNDDWDEGGDGAQEGSGQGRRLGGDKGGQRGEKTFSSRDRSDRSGGFGNQERDRNERGFGERKGGFVGERNGGFRLSDSRDQGRGGGFQGRHDREGGNFHGRDGFKEARFGSRGSSSGRGGFGQFDDKDGGPRTGGFGRSYDRDSGSRSEGFAQRTRIDGGGDQGGFGGRKGFSQGEGFNRGGTGDAGFGNKKGGFGGNKGGFGDNKGGFGDNKGGFGGSKGGFVENKGGFSGNRTLSSGGGSNEVAEDDWDTDTTPTIGTLPTKVLSPQAQSGSQPTSAVKRFRGVNSADDDVSENVFTSLKLNVRESVDVYVVYTVNPELFYCQVIKNSASLSEMMAQMNSFYEALPEGEMKIVKPEIGMPCAAKFSEDDTWYRAEIQTVREEEVEVQFVDYGNTETISVLKVCKLEPEFMKMKSQGVKSGLDGVVAKNKIWEEKAVEDFEDFTMDVHLVAKVINRSSDGTHLLELENVEEKINIGDSMCDKGHCMYVSSKISPKKDQIIESPYPVLELSVGSGIDVFVSWIENPEQFWIQPVTDDEKLIGFVDSIQELYTSGPGSDMNVTSLMPGQAVMALFSEDSAWYRGYVEKKGTKEAKVRFVDYGNSDMVARESMRQPTEAMLKEVSHAALCKLKGVRPLQTGIWTSDAKDIMNSLVSDAVKCKVVEISGKQYSVELIAGEIDVAKELIRAAVVRAEKEPSPPKSDASVVLPSKKLKTQYFQSQINVNVGSTEPVYVTQTDSVASFWCQLVKYYSELDEVMGKVDTICQSGASPDDFIVNMACAAKFSGDQSWYRAKIIAVYPDSVEVLFVDYGNSEKVPKSDIRHLNEELVELPTQAIHCTLENYAVSTNQLTKQFLELTSDLEVNMTVVEKQDDITVVGLSLSSGKSVAEELGLVTLQNDKITVKRTEQHRDDPADADISTYLKYPAAERQESSFQVYVSQIISPGDFCVQLVSQEGDLNELMEKIAKTYEDETKYKMHNVLKGQSCCSKFSEDGAWYRAEVTDIVESDITVRFVDYGNSEKTVIDKIRVITEEIIRQAPFAFCCKLADVGPAESDGWSTDCAEHFEQVVLDQELTCQFITENTVKLTLNGDDIGEKLIETGLAKSLKSKISDTEVAKSAGQVLYTDYRIPNPSLPTDLTTCYVSHVRSNGSIYLQLADEEENLHVITESLQDKASSLPELPLSTVKEGYFCIAKYSEDQAWYRAVAESVTDTSVTVRFIDYGNSDKIETSDNLKCPSEEFSKDPPYAYQCQLYGVSKLDRIDPDKVMGVTVDKELTCIFHSKAVPYEIELYDDQQQKVTELLRKEGPSDETVIPLDTEADGTQSEKVVAVDEDENRREGQEFEAKSEDCGVDMDSTVNNISELTPEILEQEQRVQVLMSHAESPSNFWVQINNKKQQLDELLNQMYDFYSTLKDNRLEVDSIEENEVVAAQYSEDKSWYRAKVKEVVEDGVMIQFLDHGNQETVGQSSLKKLSSTFSKLPLQGIQCSLAGIVPKNGGEWSAETIETFKEIVVDKDLLLDVCGILEEDLYQVQLLDMGIPVTEILVQRGVGVELLTPIPVSTKTKQVFSPETKEDIISRLFEPKASDKLTKYRYKMRDFGVPDQSVEHAALIRVINSPTNFWCQMSDSSYDYLQEKLLDSYSESSDNLQEIEVGKKCVIKLDAGEFFRGSIIKVDSDETEVTVICVDSGYIHPVKQSSLLEYKTEFDKIPQLAFQCALDIRSKTENHEWEKDICDKFKEIVLECSEVEQLPAYTKMKIIRLQEDLVTVKLTIDRLQVADYMLKLDMAELCDHVENLEIQKEPDIEASQNSREFGFFINIKLPVDSEHDVHLVNCDNLDGLVFHTVEGSAVVEEVTEKIGEYVKSYEISGEDWSEGQSCLFQCPDDDLWYRASILTTEQEQCQVFLVDYGSTYTVLKAKLLPLPEELKEIKAQAVICKLAEIDPVDGEWSDEARDFFTGHFCHDEDATLCMYIMKYKDSIHEVTLSQPSDMKSANMLMAELGYAVPILGSALEVEFLTEEAETSFHELSLAREDSYDSELGVTSSEVDTTCLTTDESHLEPDTSCLDADASHFETDTSCLDNDGSGMVEDTSAYQSGLETRESPLDTDMSNLEQSNLETDTSYTETETANETDTSQFDTETSYQETDASYMESDTSCLGTDTSHLETTDTSCLETTDTSFLETETTETSCVTSLDTSVLQGETSESCSKLIEEDLSTTMGDDSIEEGDNVRELSQNKEELVTQMSVQVLNESENKEDTDTNFEKAEDKKDDTEKDQINIVTEEQDKTENDTNCEREGGAFDPRGHQGTEESIVRENTTIVDVIPGEADQMNNDIGDPTDNEDNATGGERAMGALDCKEKQVDDNTEMSTEIENTDTVDSEHKNMNKAENVVLEESYQINQDGGENAEPNGGIDDHSDELKKPLKDNNASITQSDDSDTETFEDADVKIEENGVEVGKKEKITPDKDSADDSEAFYDIESDDDTNLKET